jgi:hypothetical protein
MDCGGEREKERENDLCLRSKERLYDFSTPDYFQAVSLAGNLRS